MKITPGHIYFISDEYFKKIHDPNLKWNHHSNRCSYGNKRPFFVAFKDKETGYYWAVPLSSRVRKYKAIIEKRQQYGKKDDIIRIAKIQGRESAFLFLDMVPIPADYFDKEYIRNGQPFYIGSRQKTNSMIRTAKKVHSMLTRGVKFSSHQVNLKHILTVLQKENYKDFLHANNRNKIKGADISLLHLELDEQISNATKDKNTLNYKADYTSLDKSISAPVL